jgi:SprT-like family
MTSSLARRLMDAYGLKDWKLVLTNSRRTMGRCVPYKRVLRISRPHIDYDPMEQVVDTILHEIAHALVGVNCGHGPVWQEMATRLGARPLPCMVTQVPPRYKTVCCGRLYLTDRLSKRRTKHCRWCGQAFAWERS